MINSKRTYPRPTDIKRMIEAVRACGLPVGSVSIGPDGVIVISQTPSQMPLAQNDFDKWNETGRL